MGETTVEDPTTAEGASPNDRIKEPGEVDVLCGRGGMSNHHPGNEWYRRLIKSNRPLYRACPKHTKLLVAKAIVQAVEQQGGRFLDKSRKTGLWFVVPYKRAVDKTSQGLRERERDDGSGNSDKNKLPISSQIANIPGSLMKSKGGGITINTAELPALTQVTIDNANRMNPDKPFIYNPAATAAAAKNNNIDPLKKQQQQRMQPPVLSNNNIMKRPMASSWQQQQQHAMPDKKRARMMGVGGRPDEDDTPLPPTLQPRQSSMYRLLKHTKLIPGAPGGGGAAVVDHLHNRARGLSPVPPPSGRGAPGGYNNNAVNRFRTNQQQQQQQQQQQHASGPSPYAAAAAPFGATAAMPPGAAAAPGPMYAAAAAAAAPPPFASIASSTFGIGSLFNMTSSSLLGTPAPAPFAPAPGAGTAAAMAASAPSASSPAPAANAPSASGTAAPALTRLTTQVSEWLTSFFPLQQNSNNNNNNANQQTTPPPAAPGVPSRRDAVQQAQAIAASLPPPGSKEQSSLPKPDKLSQPQAAAAAGPRPFGRLSARRTSLVDDEDEDETPREAMLRALPGASLFDDEKPSARPMLNPWETTTDRAPAPGALATTAQKQQPRRKPQPSDIKISLVPPPQPAPQQIQINTIPPPVPGSRRNSKRNSSNEDGMSSTNGGSAAAAAASEKRKSGSSLPELPYWAADADEDITAGLGGDVSANDPLQEDNNDDDDDPLNAPIAEAGPTELELSVSTTLLQFASSALLSGITSAFGFGGGENKNGGGGPNGQQGSSNNAGAAGAPAPPTARKDDAARERANNPSKKANDLLDDLDESPQQARLRTFGRVPTKRPNLIDDDEEEDESPRHAMLRSVPGAVLQQEQARRTSLLDV